MKHVITSAALPAVVLAWASGAQAARWNFDGGWVVDFDSVVSLGVALRTAERNCTFVGMDNGGCVGDGGSPLQESDPTSFSAQLDILRLNQDDGNLNYHRWQPVVARAQWVADLAVKGPGGWSGLLRGAVDYDAAVAQTRRTDLEPAAKDFAVSHPRLLDAFITKDLTIADHPLRIRAGNQVVSWGEALYILGGINSINSIYIPGAHSAGTPLKTLFLPAPMVSLNAPVAGGLAVETFYQWKWNAYDFDAPGTYFSTYDMLGKGGRGIYFNTATFNESLAPSALLAGELPQEIMDLIPDAFFNTLDGLTAFPPGTIGDPGTHIVGNDPQTNQPYNRRLSHEELTDPDRNPLGPLLGTGTVIERVADREPQGEQYGIALRYTAEESGNEYAFFYLRYHDKIPYASYNVVDTKANPISLELAFEYGPDRDLYGLSTNFILGDWQFGTELSYRPKDGVPIDRSTVIDTENPYYCSNYSNSNFAPLYEGTDTPIGTHCQGWIDTQNYQFQISGLNIVSPSGPLSWILNWTGASESILIAELAMGYYPDLELDGGIPYAASLDYALPTKKIIGAVAYGSLTWPEIFGTRASLMPDLVVLQGIRGYPATYLPGFIEGAGAATLGFNVDFKTALTTKMRLDYTHNWGGGDTNLLRDRNFMSASVTVEF